MPEPSQKPEQPAAPQRPLPVTQSPPVEPTIADGPFHVIAKPVGAICNINCEYCFYLEKEHLYPKDETFKMPEAVLEKYVHQYIAGQPAGTAEVNFAWQGGEPTLRGLDFFRRVVELQKAYATPGMRVSNAFQTNAILIDDDWAGFLRECEFLVGVSIDGPEKLHDRYRKDKGGRGTFQRVMRGLENLKKHQVEFNTLTVVQQSNSNHPTEVYDFLEEIGSTFFQFIPIVEVEESGQVSDRSVRPKQWGKFLNGIFKRWIEKDDIGRIFVQHFDLMLGLAMGLPSSLCVHAQTCGRAAAIEHNGDLFSCDHFVNWEDLLGNVNETSVGEMIEGSKQQTFGRNKRDLLPKYCRECEFLNYCWGGCPAHRNATTPDGEPGLNFLCEGYKLFYGSTIPYFKAMGECLNRRRPARDFRMFMADSEPSGPGRQPAGARTQMPAGPTKGRAAKVKPNSPCPCGSGKKYKKCCGVP